MPAFSMKPAAPTICPAAGRRAFVLGTPARETWLAGPMALAALFPGRDGVDFAAVAAASD